MSESVETAADKYLEFHSHSPAAQETVKQSLNQFYHLVHLATERALESLYIPDNVIELPIRTDNNRLA